MARTRKAGFREDCQRLCRGTCCRITPGPTTCAIEEALDDVHYVATLGSYRRWFHTQSGYIVLEVIGLREKDFTPAYGGGAEMDKATAAKFLDVVPVGDRCRYERWLVSLSVSTFPSLYADALYARDEDLDRIFKVEQPPDKVTKADADEALTLKAVCLIQRDWYVSRLQGLSGQGATRCSFWGAYCYSRTREVGMSCTVATIFQSVFMKPDDFGAIGAAFVIFASAENIGQSLDKLPCKIKSSYLKATDPGTGD